MCQFKFQSYEIYLARYLCFIRHNLIKLSRTGLCSHIIAKYYICKSLLQLASFLPNDDLRCETRLVGREAGEGGRERLAYLNQSFDGDDSTIFHPQKNLQYDLYMQTCLQEGHEPTFVPPKPKLLQWWAQCFLGGIFFRGGGV